MKAAHDSQSKTRKGQAVAAAIWFLLVSGCEQKQNSLYRNVAQPGPTPHGEMSSRDSVPTYRNDSSSPRVIGEITSGDLRKFYPEEAKNRHIEGIVQIAVTIDAIGRATDTRIISESPRDMGFGAAASALAHTLAYSNPMGGDATLTISVRFDQREMSARLHRRRHHI